MKKINLFFICIFLIIATLFSGCSQINKLQVKLGFKNNDFEYMNQGKVKKVVIQSTRDSGYKFTLTNSVAIAEIYDILSTAKPVSTKSSLKPDYTFDIYEGDKIVHQFNYIVGLDKNDGGNLYSSDKNYIVANRIDSEILDEFNDDRTPKDFSDIYYPLITQCVNKYISSTNSGSKSIGIDVNDDIGVQKYIFSAELDDFEKSLPSNASVLNDSNGACDIKATVTTQGYKYGSFTYDDATIEKDTKTKSYTSSYIYKCIVNFHNNSTGVDKKYYVVGINQGTGWSVYISETKNSNF